MSVDITVLSAYKCFPDGGFSPTTIWPGPCARRGQLSSAASRVRGKGSDCAPRMHTQSSVPQGPDATEATDQAGPPALRPTPYALRPTPYAWKRWGPVFGQIKQGRGFRQFLLRGLEKVQGEWSLICTGHNLLKLFRFGARGSGRVRDKGAAGHSKESHGIAARGIFRLLPAYTYPRRSGMVAVSRSQLNPGQSGIPRTGC